jgi:HEAT repeat protein
LSGEESKVLEALQEAGVRAASVWDLPNARTSYTKALPTLVALLPEVHDHRVKEAIVRALAVREAQGMATGPLIAELRRLRMMDPVATPLAWAIGNALSVVVEPGSHYFADLVELLRDRLLGRGRQMLAEALARTEDGRAVGVLIELLSDSDLTGHVLYALGKMKATAARPHIEKYLAHANPWVRKEARRAAAKIEKATMAAGPAARY